MPFVVTEPATVYPVTLAEVKEQAVVSTSEDDVLLGRLLKAAAVFGENITGRKFVAVTYQLDLDEFPAGKIALRPNLQSVASVTYVDSDDVTQTVATGDYKVKTTGLVGYVKPVESWPYGAEDVLVTFNAGWPLDTEDVATTPEDIRHWIMAKVADTYLQRENFIISFGGKGGVGEMPRSFIDDMLSNYIVPGVGAGI